MIYVKSSLTQGLYPNQLILHIDIEGLLFNKKLAVVSNLSEENRKQEINFLIDRKLTEAIRDWLFYYRKKFGPVERKFESILFIKETPT